MKKLICRKNDTVKCTIEVKPYESTIKIAGLLNSISVIIKGKRTVDDQIKVFQTAFERKWSDKVSLFRGSIDSIDQEALIRVKRETYNVKVDVMLLNGTELASIDLEDINIYVDEEESD